jgi:hypothetical protein
MIFRREVTQLAEGRRFVPGFPTLYILDADTCSFGGVGKCYLGTVSRWRMILLNS